MRLWRKHYPDKAVIEMFLLPYRRNRKNEFTTLTKMLEQNEKTNEDGKITAFKARHGNFEGRGASGDDEGIDAGAASSDGDQQGLGHRKAEGLGANAKGLAGGTEQEGIHGSVLGLSEELPDTGEGEGEQLREQEQSGSSIPEPGHSEPGRDDQETVG